MDMTVRVNLRMARNLVPVTSRMRFHNLIWQRIVLFVSEALSFDGRKYKQIYEYGVISCQR